MGNHLAKPPPPKILKSDHLNDEKATRNNDEKYDNEIITVDSRSTIASRYAQPDSTKDQDIMIASHYLNRFVWQNHFSAPMNEKLKSGARVLDVCCGVGTWILEMSHDYQASTLTGFDILPNFPKDIKPPNVTFTQSDALKTPWPFDNASFDFVYIRDVKFVFASEEWQRIVLPEVYRVLKPDGYFEFSEHPVMPCNVGPTALRLANLVKADLTNEGYEPDLNSRVHEWLLASPLFSDVQTEERTCPSGTWGGRIGEASSAVLDNSLINIKPTLMHQLSVDDDGFLELLRNIQDERNEYKTYYEFKRVWARRLAGEQITTCDEIFFPPM